ncbi:MAG: hypothetical protein R2880_15050 [Deinococcales bacterium]
MAQLDPERLDLYKAARGGICAFCRQARLVKSAKGSLFLLCQHPNLPKYAPQPQFNCWAFEALDPSDKTPN